MTFYDEFIEDKNKTSIDHELYDNNLKVEKFLEHFIENNPITYEAVKMLSNGLKNYINKPQRLIQSNENNYVAIDMHTNIYYICFRDIIMFDIDLKETTSFFKKIKKEYLINKFKSYEDDVFYLDESSNGFHIYLLNKRINHKSEEMVKYLVDFNCDIKYIICSYIRGYSTRVNKKTDFDMMYRHCGIYGNKELIDQEILADVEEINDCVEEYQFLKKY